MNSLFDPGPATGNLTHRQALVLELLRANPQGLRSSDIGREIHMAKGCPYCSPERLCKYAMTAGEEVGRQLRKRDLAIKRKASGRWQLLRTVRVGDSNDFPEGY